MIPAQLHDNVHPVNYRLHFEPDSALGVIHGKETVTLDIANPTQSLVLHAKDITVGDIVVHAAGITESNNYCVSAQSVNYDSDAQTITVQLPAAIRGNAELSFQFTSKFGDVVGMYEAEYSSPTGSKQVMMSTDFEPTYARWAFPCIDEPAAKATFDVSATLDERLQAISNTTELSTVLASNGKKTVSFQITPNMPTYLLYLGIGQFDTLEKQCGNVLIRAITTPGKARKYCGFALEAAEKFLKFYESYFDIPYPLPKLDLIGVPNFVSGAMEN